MATRRNNENDPNFDPLINSSINAFSRLSRQAQLVVVVLILSTAIVVAVFYFRAQRQQQQSAQQSTVPTVPATQRSSPIALSPDLLLGNPSGATTNPSNKTNYLMVKPYYSLSYNDAKGTPNWVSWRVASTDLGTAPRKQVFDLDDTLPAGFYHVAHRDYTGSGFDRGHMCPHSDRAANQTMSYATFMMTNIIPQAPNVNQKAWAQVEEYCGQLVRSGDRLYIISGPAGQGGVGRNGPAQTVAAGRVVVPAECWKIIVIVPESGGDDDLAKLNAGTRVLTVDMPNDESQVGEEWARYRTSPDEVERKTGYHFFDRVRPDVAAALRSKVDAVALPAPKPMAY